MLAFRTGLQWWMLLVHAGASLIALASGPWQFLPRLRQRRPQVHRNIGFVYLAGVAIGALSGAYVATGSLGGLVAHCGFFTLSLVWLASAIAAFRRVKAGDIAGHREWMIRNYALTFAAVTLRLYLPMIVAAGFTFEAAYQTVAWMCWVPNWMVVEFTLQARRKTA